MKIDEIFQLAQSANVGGSGRGISFYSTAAACGRRAALQELEKATAQLADDEAPEAELSGTGTGTAYHLLHEHCASDDPWDARDGAYNPNFIEALRVFRGWRSAWGSIEEKYGARVIGSEIEVADSGALFGREVTGKIDKLIEVIDPTAAFANTGLHLLPGVWMLDFKCLKSAGKNDAEKYSSSLQGINYLALYNRMHPEAPAIGMVYDIVYKHREITRLPTYDSKGAVKKGSSFAHYVQFPGSDDLPRIQNLVQLGGRNFDENRPNPSACIGPFGEACPFWTSGKCKGV